MVSGPDLYRLPDDVLRLCGGRHQRLRRQPGRLPVSGQRYRDHQRYADRHADPHRHHLLPVGPALHHPGAEKGHQVGGRGLLLRHGYRGVLLRPYHQLHQLYHRPVFRADLRHLSGLCRPPRLCGLLVPHPEGRGYGLDHHGPAPDQHDPGALRDLVLRR